MNQCLFDLEYVFKPVISLGANACTIYMLKASRVAINFPSPIGYLKKISTLSPSIRRNRDPLVRTWPSCNVWERTTGCFFCLIEAIITTCKSVITALCAGLLWHWPYTNVPCWPRKLGCQDWFWQRVQRRIRPI